jgi:hypothetical protein
MRCIFQTAGQLLKAMVEANLSFNEGGIIFINHGEDNISTLTSGQGSAKTGDTDTTVPHPLTIEWLHYYYLVKISCS